MPSPPRSGLISRTGGLVPTGQTNGKVERFNRTLLDEWAYARPYSSEAERVAAITGWLHTYHHHRGHTALGGKSPADRVPNLSRQNS